jgi:uncharacterized protein (DUF2141 family)
MGSGLKGKRGELKVTVFDDRDTWPISEKMTSVN